MGVNIQHVQNLFSKIIEKISEYEPKVMKTKKVYGKRSKNKQKRNNNITSSKILHFPIKLRKFYNLFSICKASSLGEQKKNSTYSRKRDRKKEIGGWCS